MTKKVKETESIESIESLWLQIDKKFEFIVWLSKEMDRSVYTLRSHWFSKHGFWGVPNDLRDEVVGKMKKHIKEQSKK